MRTILVNARRRRRRSYTVANPLIQANAVLANRPRKRKKSRSRKHQYWGIVKGHQRRTHNPTPLYMMNPRRRRRYHRSNPLILPNRRRYRRRNPSFSLGGMFNTLLTGAVGGGLVWALNKYAIAKIQLQPDGTYPPGPSALWWHVGARAIASGIAGFFLPTGIANAANGALAYASFREVENYYAANAVSTGADLHGLEADLSDVLDGY